MERLLGQFELEGKHRPTQPLDERRPIRPVGLCVSRLGASAWFEGRRVDPLILNRLQPSRSRSPQAEFIESVATDQGPEVDGSHYDRLEFLHEEAHDTSDRVNFGLTL